MTVETDSVEIENFAFLKLRAAPDQRERWQSRTGFAIRRPHANDHWPVLVRDRIKVIDRFEIAGNFFFGRLIDFFLIPFHDRFYLHCFLYDAIEPIDPGNI